MSIRINERGSIDKGQSHVSAPPPLGASRIRVPAAGRTATTRAAPTSPRPQRPRREGRSCVVSSHKSRPWGGRPQKLLLPSARTVHCTITTLQTDVRQNTTEREEIADKNREKRAGRIKSRHSQCRWARRAAIVRHRQRKALWSGAAAFELR